MKPILRDLGLGLSVIIATPAAVLAQSPMPSSPAIPPPAATPEGAGARIAAIAVPLLLLIIIVACVKLYDLKRKRDEEAMSLEARISDALLIDPALTGFPVVATVHMPPLRRSEPVVEITGTVPTTGLRETAVDIVNRECSIHGAHAQIEDRVAVDPLVLARVA